MRNSYHKGNRDYNDYRMNGHYKNGYKFDRMYNRKNMNYNNDQMFGNYNSFEQAIGESNENSDKHRMNSHQDSKSNNQDSESSNKGRSEGHPMMQAEAIGTFAQVNFHTIISIFAVIGGMSMI